jgi:prepilin signal peptidase PulO-like enzyme (type II secretory pathway)
MDLLILYFALVLFGLSLGSFAAASVWRLRARQLIDDKQNGEKVDKVEYERLKKISKKSFFNDHSRCLECSYILKWYDLVPLISWLSLGGKCRKCHKSIGYLEPMSEIGLAVFFVLSYAFWPYPLESSIEIARLLMWLISGVGLEILFIYDKKWFLLPSLVNYSVVVLGLFSAILVVIQSQDKFGTLLSITGSVIILSGLYWFLGIISKGRWIGQGDVWLGLGLALLLADWKLAFIALFSANLVGCLVVFPALISNRLNLKSHVPFGPLLIIGFVIAGLAGNYLINIIFYSLN